eukprot:751727-Hanusia_phi.AAC.7
MRTLMNSALISCLRYSPSEPLTPHAQAQDLDYNEEKSIQQDPSSSPLLDPARCVCFFLLPLREQEQNSATSPEEKNFKERHQGQRQTIR